MAICYTTSLSKLDEDKVLDSRFYDPQKMRLLKYLDRESHQKISDEYNEIINLATQTNYNIFPAMVYDLPHSLSNIFVDGKIIKSSAELGSTKKIGQEGDLAVSRLRYYLKEFAILPSKEIPQLLSTEYVLIRSKGNISTSLLLPFLLIKEVQYIFECSQRGSNHPRLANKDILKLPLPNKLVELDKSFTSIVKNILLKFKNSCKLYPEAEQELLKRMQWDKIDKKHILDYSTTSKKIFESERVDPEFYQPKFENLINHLKKIGSMKIVQICNFVNHGIQPPYFDNGNILVITQKEMTPTFLEKDSIKDFTNENFYKQNSDFQLREKDVLLYSVGAYIGRCNILLEKIKAMAGSFITVLRADNTHILPEYLSLFLNSQSGIMQAKQHMRGTAQHYLYPRDIRKIEVFIPKNKNDKPDLKWQKKLADKVIQAYNAKKEAKQKLQEAKNLVGKEIEELLKK